MSLNYLALIILVFGLGLGSQLLVRSAYRKWKKRPVSFGVSGADAARTMLNSYGLFNTTIVEVQGELNDHFDPRTNIVSLSREVYHGQTVSAVAIACHESGHAVQHEQQYLPAKLRASIFPAVSLASNMWVFVLLAGIFFSIIGLVYAAIILFCAVLVFQLVTLPVELDATRRATSFIQNSGWLTQVEFGGAKSVLRSASMTYVAAAVASILQLMYLLGVARR